MRTLLCLFALVGTLRAEGPPLPQALPGSLVLVGGGSFPEEARNRFFLLAGKEKAKIVVVPTASADAAKDNADELFLAQWKKLEPASVVLLHAKDRATADTVEFTKALREATAVWISGGDQSRLTERYLGTATLKEIRGVLERGGVVGGTSAGCAVLCDRMIASGTDKPVVAPGFALLPGVILDQHFVARKREPRLTAAIEANPGYVGLGIDEGTAVVIRGRDIKVYGTSTATFLWTASHDRPALEQVLRAGDTADLLAVCRAARFRAEKQFPAARPGVPEVESGTLIVVGGGALPKSIVQKFIDLAGGPDALIVYVATAHEDPVPKNPGEIALMKSLGAKNIRVLHTRDRKEADTPEFLKGLEGAKAVWFSGGRHWRFIDSYEGTRTEAFFKDVLKRGGVIAGSSAGASIQAEYMPRGHPLGNTIVMAEGYERGFGYLPGVVVDQHFFKRDRFADMTGAMAKIPQYLGIGLDEGTAIVVAKSRMEVMGLSKVAVYNRIDKADANAEKDYLELSAGSVYDLKARKVVPQPEKP